FVGIDVTMVVRRRNGVRVEVIRTRTEGAHDEAIAFERLMHRRRLMDAANDRLEVVDVERPRVEVPVPADAVEWMVVENQLVDTVVLFYEKCEVAHLVVRVQLLRNADVALGIRRAFLELAEFVAIALWPTDVATTLHHEELRLVFRVRVEA